MNELVTGSVESVGEDGKRWKRRGEKKRKMERKSKRGGENLYEMK